MTALLIANDFKKPFKSFRKDLKSDIRHCDEYLDPPLQPI